MLRFTGGNAEGGGFTLIPEIDDVQVTFVKAEAHSQNPNRLKFIFRIDDYDEDEAPEDMPNIIGTDHWESANRPAGQITPRHRLHFLISGLIGHTFQDGEDVALEEFFGSQYKADFKHVPAQVANGDGSFSVRKDDNGKVMMKAQISRLKPIKKAKTARNVFQEAEDAA